jgi:hypothetical protein
MNPCAAAVLAFPQCKYSLAVQVGFLQLGAIFMPTIAIPAHVLHKFNTMP